MFQDSIWSIFPRKRNDHVWEIHSTWKKMKNMGAFHIDNSTIACTLVNKVG